MKLLSNKEKWALGLLLLLVAGLAISLILKNSPSDIRQQAAESGTCSCSDFTSADTCTNNSHHTGCAFAGMTCVGDCKLISPLGETCTTEGSTRCKNTTRQICKNKTWTSHDNQYWCDSSGDILECASTGNTKVKNACNPKCCTAQVCSASGDSGPGCTSSGGGGGGGGSGDNPTPTPRFNDNPCYVLVFDGQNNQEANPIEGNINESGLCMGSFGETYSSFYKTREEALADKQTAHYPCQNFPDRTTTCQVNATATGRKICAGGPTSEYLWCLHQDSAQIIKISGPNPIASDTSSAPTPTSVPTTTPVLSSCPSQCSNIYEKQRLQWQDYYCDEQPTTQSVGIVRTFDASCHVTPEALAKQCNRCSKVEVGAYKWWLLGGGNTNCQIDPVPGTEILSATAPQECPAPYSTITPTQKPTAIPTQKPPATPTPTRTLPGPNLCPGFDPADLNCDGKINLADYEIMLDAFDF